MNEVTYERVRDIDFTSAKKLKENLDIKIDSLDQIKATSRETQPCDAQTAVHSQLIKCYNTVNIILLCSRYISLHKNILTLEKELAKNMTNCTN